jgi:hypothetical protein
VLSQSHYYWVILSYLNVSLGRRQVMKHMICDMNASVLRCDHSASTSRKSTPHPSPLSLSLARGHLDRRLPPSEFSTLAINRRGAPYLAIMQCREIQRPVLENGVEEIRNKRGCWFTRMCMSLLFLSSFSRAETMEPPGHHIKYRQWHLTSPYQNNYLSNHAIKPAQYTEIKGNLFFVHISARLHQNQG